MTVEPPLAVEPTMPGVPGSTLPPVEGPMLEPLPPDPSPLPPPTLIPPLPPGAGETSPLAPLPEARRPAGRVARWTETSRFSACRLGMMTMMTTIAIDAPPRAPTPLAVDLPDRAVRPRSLGGWAPPTIWREGVAVTRPAGTQQIRLRITSKERCDDGDGNGGSSSD